MAEKKKSGKRRKDDFASDSTHGVADKASKEEYAVAKWLRSNVPRKKTKFLNYQVEYFTGSKAVDALLDSKWAKDKSPLFTERIEVIDLLQEMLEHKFFHRAKKVPVTEQELKGSKKKKDNEKSDKEDEKKKTKEGEKSSNSAAECKELKDAKEKEKKKRKIRLEMHMDQLFVDGADAYVWIYDPIPLHYWLAGCGLLLGAIGVCLFPLWPPTVRKGVYYLSLAAAGFLVMIIVLVILRLIIFCLIWMMTLSKHHFWILPNLTEDVSFFASFWPLYKYEYKGSDSSSGKDKDKKKKKKEKLSDNEADDDKTPLLDEKTEKQTDASREQQESSAHETAEPPNQENVTESESESSQRSSTGKDFEMVDPGDVDTS